MARRSVCSTSVSPSPLRFRSVSAGAVLALLTAGCQPNPGLLKHARSGQLAELNVELQDIARSGRADAELLSSIAEAELSGEVERAHGEEGAQAIDQLSPCAVSLRSALNQRSAKRDAPGAAAAALLVTADDWDEADLESFRDATEPRWRALAASEADEADPKQQKAWLLDGDERVRQSAIDALKRLPGDETFAMLAEAARLDPNPYNRARALRAIGEGGAEGALPFLLERMSEPEESERLASLEALSLLAEDSKDAASALMGLAETAQGRLALEAAGAILRLPAGSADERQGFSSPRDIARATVRALATGGTPDEQARALDLLPRQEPETLTLWKQAAQSRSAEVRFRAALRLAGVPKEREGALAMLRKASQEDGPRRLSALAVLAAEGDEMSLAMLVTLSRSKSAQLRRVAAFGLIRLSRWADVAALLADPDAGTRRDIACRILTNEP